jgi:hypothetical protein
MSDGICLQKSVLGLEFGYGQWNVMNHELWSGLLAVVWITWAVAFALRQRILKSMLWGLMLSA